MHHDAKSHFIRTAIICLAAFSSSVLATPSFATVINFDDISVPGDGVPVPAGYQGFTWSGGFGTDSWIVSPVSAAAVWGFSGPTWAESDPNFAWSNGATDLSLSVGTGTYNLTSLWARGGISGSFSAIAHGFNGATELYTEILDLTGTYQLFTLDFNGITEWTLTNQTPNTLIDDITVSQTVSQVPEPSTLAIFGIGLLGLAGVRMLRSKPDTDGRHGRFDWTVS